MASKTKILIGIIIIIIGIILTTLLLWSKQTSEENDVEVILPIDSPEEAISYAKTISEVQQFISGGSSRGNKIINNAEFDTKNNLWSVLFRSDETQLMMGIYSNGTISYKGYGI